MSFSDCESAIWSWFLCRLSGDDEGRYEQERVILEYFDFVNSDDEQNRKFLEIAKNHEELLASWLREMLGGAVDINPGATGDFGHDINNPIPVNGTFGELTYLSRLLTSSGKKIVFHRLGSIGTIDVFETVSQSGDEWDILFLDSYHTRKTRLTPKNYKFQVDDDGRPFTIWIRGVDGCIEDFPLSFYDVLKNKITLGMKLISDPEAQKIIGLRRPKSQIKIVEECVSQLEGQTMLKLSGNEVIVELNVK